MKRLNGSVRFDTFNVVDKTSRTWRKYAIEIVLPADSEFVKHAVLAAWNAKLAEDRKPLKALDDVTDKMCANVRAKIAFYGFASNAPKCVAPLVPHLGKRADGQPGIALKQDAPLFLADAGEVLPDDWTTPWLKAENAVKVNKAAERTRNGKVIPETTFITFCVDNRVEWWKTALDAMTVSRYSEGIDLSGDSVQQTSDDTPDASDESVPF